MVYTAGLCLSTKRKAIEYRLQLKVIYPYYYYYLFGQDFNKQYMIQYY